MDMKKSDIDVLQQNLIKSIGYDAPSLYGEGPFSYADLHDAEISLCREIEYRAIEELRAVKNIFRETRHVK